MGPLHGPFFILISAGEERHGTGSPLFRTELHKARSRTRWSTVSSLCSVFVFLCLRERVCSNENKLIPASGSINTKESQTVDGFADGFVSGQTSIYLQQSFQPHKARTTVDSMLTIISVYVFVSCFNSIFNVMAS